MNVAHRTHMQTTVQLCCMIGSVNRTRKLYTIVGLSTDGRDRSNTDKLSRLLKPNSF